jgi:hypothetical protein
MAKKFKVGCRYRVKPECYNEFWFSTEWEGRDKDEIFTVSRVSELGGAFNLAGIMLASGDERKYCKRIKD